MSKKQFYDPHPGLLGCIEPLPEAVRLKAADMDGNFFTVDEAIAMIKEVAPEDYEVKAHDSFISLSGGEFIDVPTKPPMQTRSFNWRVLRFREVESKNCSGDEK